MCFSVVVVVFCSVWIRKCTVEILTALLYLKEVYWKGRECSDRMVGTRFKESTFRLDMRKKTL